MKHAKAIRRLSPAFGFLSLLVAVSSVLTAEEPVPRRATFRKLLFPVEVKGPLAGVVGHLTRPGQPVVADADLKASRYFVRVIPRKYVLDGVSLRAEAWLGPRPFVFLTAPEALYGKGLLRVFSDIGYSAEQILAGQLGEKEEEMVAVVFRYPDDVRLHPGVCGNLPRQWRRAVCAPTWANVFALVEQLATEAEVDAGADPKRPAPERLVLASERQRKFLAGFPPSGRKRLGEVHYRRLREVGGADWEYRSFLEDQLGMSEHFAGTGRTRPAIRPPGKERLGLPEWLGPNARLGKLPEVAVVGLGALRAAQ